MPNTEYSQLELKQEKWEKWSTAIAKYTASAMPLQQRWRPRRYVELEVLNCNNTSRGGGGGYSRCKAYGGVIGRFFEKNP